MADAIKSRPAARKARRRPGAPSRAERSAMTRDRILSRASRMFADRGFDAVTTREIAKAAGVTFPVMYRHFPDKRTLYLTAFGSALARADTKYLALMSGFEGPESCLFAFVSELYGDLLSDPCLSKLMQREILDRDDAGIEQLTKEYFVQPYLVVKRSCDSLVGKSQARLASLLIYLVTMGFVQFRPIGQVVDAERVKWNDPRSVARVILELIFPRTNWARVCERQPRL